MPISHWPLEERPREKLLLQGVNALSTAELLALFFRIGIKGQTAIDLARHALKHFGSLRALLDADVNTFIKIKGLSTRKYSELQAALELSRRYVSEKLTSREIITNAKDTQHFLISKLRHRPSEVFAMLCLDNQNRLINYHELFYGTINYTNVYPRGIIQHALKQNAAAVIFAHNHPSGSINPSKADREMTYELNQALAYVDIQLLDHIIVGDTSCSSMANLGFI